MIDDDLLPREWIRGRKKENGKGALIHVYVRVMHSTPTPSPYYLLLLCMTMMISIVCLIYPPHLLDTILACGEDGDEERRIDLTAGPNKAVVIQCHTLCCAARLSAMLFLPLSLYLPGLSTEYWRACSNISRRGALSCKYVACARLLPETRCFIPVVPYTRI